MILFSKSCAFTEVLFTSTIGRSSVTTLTEQGGKFSTAAVLKHFFVKCSCFFCFFGICPPPGVLPVLGPCEPYMTLTLDAALLISSRAVNHISSSYLVYLTV